MSMREIEREQILAERREENERIRQNRMLRQLKVNQEKKRKASLAELDDSSRKTSRARTKADDKMDSLRRAREERSNRKEQRERENDRRKRSPSYRRSPGRGDDSDVDWDGPSKKKHRSRSPGSRESPPAELRDFERVRVGRSRFAEVAFYPGFDEALTGCFVRLNIGPDPDTRQDVYRMALIKGKIFLAIPLFHFRVTNIHRAGFTTGKAYALEDHQGHQMVVDMYVKAAHGKAVREWPLITCSDRKFTDVCIPFLPSPVILSNWTLNRPSTTATNKSVLPRVSPSRTNRPLLTRSTTSTVSSSVLGPSRSSQKSSSVRTRCRPSSLVPNVTISRSSWTMLDRPTTKPPSPATRSVSRSSRCPALPSAPHSPRKTARRS